MITRRTLKVDEEVCEGCGNCEGTCPINNILMALPDIPDPESQIIITSSSGSVKIQNERNCVECERCVEACPTGAIELSNGNPELDSEKCIGCGNCRATCPVNYHINDFPYVDEPDTQVVVRVEDDVSTVICEFNCVECEECVKKCDNEAIRLVEEMV